jgi:hypothetical protein
VSSFCPHAAAAQAHNTTAAAVISLGIAGMILLNLLQCGLDGV